MRSYLIFDCTTLDTAADVTVYGPEIVARIAAAWRSRLTGRFHDYTAVN